jgi:hypothetical protein
MDQKLLLRQQMRQEMDDEIAQRTKIHQDKIERLRVAAQSRKAWRESPVAATMWRVINFVFSLIMPILPRANRFANGVPIFGHCYDFPIPNGAHPTCAGPWLKPSLDFCGYNLVQGTNCSAGSCRFQEPSDVSRERSSEQFHFDFYPGRASGR